MWMLLVVVAAVAVAAVAVAAIAMQRVVFDFVLAMVSTFCVVW